MPKEALLQGIKFWGTALIIAAAALIMMPGLLTYFMGLSRILLIVIITLVVATVVGNIIFRLRRPVQSNVTANGSPADQPEAAAAAPLHSAIVSPASTSDVSTQD